MDLDLNETERTALYYKLGYITDKFNYVGPRRHSLDNGGSADVILVRNQDIARIIFDSSQESSGFSLTCVFHYSKGRQTIDRAFIAHHELSLEEYEEITGQGYAEIKEEAAKLIAIRAQGNPASIHLAEKEAVTKISALEQDINAKATTLQHAHFGHMIDQLVAATSP
jgi:hypothetical protein